MLLVMIEKLYSTNTALQLHLKECRFRLEKSVIDHNNCCNLRNWSTRAILVSLFVNPKSPDRK